MPPPRRAKNGQGNAEQAERLIEVWNLRIEGLLEREIAERLGINQSTVSRWLKKAYSMRAEPVAAELRAVELDKLDVAEQAVWAVLRRKHVTVSAGKIVYNDSDGEPIIDDGPILAAVDRLVKISERRAKYGGLDAPSKVEAQVTTPDIDPALAARLAEARERIAERKQQIIEGEA